jgi:predicted DNA binding CopG/RHH family protein
MKAKRSGKAFSDPFDELTDEEFDREIAEALDRSTTKISLRVPSDLLGRTRHEAGRLGVAYQSLMKVLIDQGVRRLESVPRRAVRRVGSVKVRRQSRAARARRG